MCTGATRSTFSIFYLDVNAGYAVRAPEPSGSIEAALETHWGSIGISLSRDRKQRHFETALGIKCKDSSAEAEWGSIWSELRNRPLSPLSKSAIVNIRKKKKTTLAGPLK